MEPTERFFPTFKIEPVGLLLDIWRPESIMSFCDLGVRSAPFCMPASERTAMAALGRVFHVDHTGPTMIVSPRGPAMNYLYKDVHTESNGLLEEFLLNKRSHVVVDLSQVDYIDSIIIGSLIRLLQKARTSGGQAVFCSASANMQSILSCIKIGSLWPLFATREEALASIPAS